MTAHEIVENVLSSSSTSKTPTATAEYEIAQVQALMAASLQFNENDDANRWSAAILYAAFCGPRRTPRLSTRIESPTVSSRRSQPLSDVHNRRRRRTSSSHVPQRSARANHRRSRVITIVLAEEQRLVRHGVRCLLESEDDFKVIGQTGDGLEVGGLVQRLRPRVLVIAVAMPGLSGLEVVRQVRERFPATAVLMLSMYSKEEYVRQALRNGASGYVLKHARPSELSRAIRQVVAGHRYLSEPMSERSIRTWLKQADREAGDAYEMLTDRERQVLQLVAEGHSSTGIAARLGISPRTVEAHRANVMRKMNFRHLVDVIVFAIARGIVIRPQSEPLDR